MRRSAPFPDPQTIKDAEAHRLVDALRTRVEINTHLEAELDSLDFIELYRDLDDADKSGVPQPGTQNRSYRMMMGRARPPIVEFGAHGRWYLGSRATKRTQAIEMCFKCAESKAQIHAEEEIRDSPTQKETGRRGLFRRRRQSTTPDRSVRTPCGYSCIKPSALKGVRHRPVVMTIPLTTQKPEKLVLKIECYWGYMNGGE